MLPALDKAKSTAHSASCCSNLKQLQAGFLLYADDNDDRQPPDMTKDGFSLPGSWVLGNAQTDTNTANIAAGVLYPYVGAVGVYRCPADQAPVNGCPGLRRARSYSHSGWVGAPGDFNISGNKTNRLSDYPWGTYKVSQHRFPPPSEVFVFLDEHEQSINAGVFYTTQPAWVAGGSPQDSRVWWSVPADRHKQGCNLSFLDGHAEHWRWKALKVYKGVDFPASPGADLQDLLRLEEHVPHDPL